jgi:hypothetical protein
VLIVRLRGAPCRRERRAFFARMHAEARRLGVVMSHKLGVCLFFGAERICAGAHRHQMVNWLIDQPEVRSVDVDELRHLGDLLAQRSRFAADIGPSATQRQAGRDLVRRVAAGAVAQWAVYLQGRLS